MACKYQYNNQWYSKEELVNKLSQENSNFKTLYQNLVNEITNTETGRKVLDRIKRDYVTKEKPKSKNYNLIDSKNNSEIKIIQNFGNYWFKEYNETLTRGKQFETNEELEQLISKEQNKHILGKYTLEEQQEEAIVTLLGLMAADKLDAKKDATLISKLKELWKQISDFVKQLLRQDSIKIDELPITTTLNDLAEIMGYGNNKIILPGYKVEYSTPLGNKYDTLEEVNQEIRGLADADTEVDLSGVKINPQNKIDKFNNNKEVDKVYSDYIQEPGFNFHEVTIYYKDGSIKKYDYDSLPKEQYDFYRNIEFRKGDLNQFIEKNKEFEQSKEIIEQWKKENNIQYDPEEVYSRGQGFYSSIGAYSNLELDLLLKNLIQHIQDNKKASQPNVILPIGTSGSGKSTFIKSLPQENLVIIEPDAMRVEFTGDMNDKSKDKEIYIEAAQRAIKAIKQGKQVVFDTTNLTKDKRLPFIEAIKKEIPNANIQYKLMELNPELAKQRIKADIAAGKNRANVPDSTIDRHAESYKQMLEDIKNEPITPYGSNYGFTISAFTKPIDKRLEHIEGTGDRVRFVIYPKSNHIKWAAPTDVFSGSVWDAHEKVSKDKKSELLGVSFTKAPALRNINEVSPNLADIIDNLSHAHNELGIELTTDNFRIEYDESVPYEIKKLVNSINSILDSRYGKIVKPEISKIEKSDYRYTVEWNDIQDPNEVFHFKTEQEAINYANKLNTENGNTKTAKDIEDYGGYVVRFTTQKQGIQPTQTEHNLKESIESVKKKLNNLTPEQIKELNDKVENGEITDEEEYNTYIFNNLDKINKKEYTSQALINTKIAKLKEVARKYPRSLITSKVVPINPNLVDNSEIQYSKIASKQGKEFAEFNNFVQYNKNFKQQLAEDSIEQIITSLQERLNVEAKIITPEEAKELTKNTKYPWNGEGAFFLNGEVYVVGKENLTLENVFHEFSHPFIRAVRKQNPKLFNSLYREHATEEFVAYILHLYPELEQEIEKGNVVGFMEELLVHALTNRVLLERKEVKSILEKFWLALKQILRKIFPNAKSLSNLNENTSLHDLAKILLYENVDLNADILDSFMNPMFSRKLQEELQKIDPNQVNQTINESLSLILEHNKRIAQNKNLSELKVFFTEEEQKGEIFNTREGLKRASRLIDLIEKDQDKLRNFGESLKSLQLFTEQFAKHARDLSKQEMEPYEKIGILRNYIYISKDWQGVLEPFIKNMKVGAYKETPELSKVLSEIIANMEDVYDFAQDYIEQDGLPQLLADDIQKNKFMSSAREKLLQEVEELKKQKKDGRTIVFDGLKKKTIDEVIKEKQKLYKNTEPSKQVIKQWLTGKLGDTNGLSINWESYTSNPNPIVGGFANFFMKKKAKLEAMLQERFQKFFNNLSKINVSKNDIRTTFDKVTSKITKGFYNKETDEFEKREYYTLLNQYKGDYQYILDKFEHELSKILENNNNEKNQEYYTKKKEMNKFISDYMFSVNTDKFNEAKQFWLQSTDHIKAQEIRQIALDSLNEVQRRNPLTQDEIDQKEVDLKEAIREYQQLTKLTDDFGNPKKDQITPNIIKEYQQRFGKMYERLEVKGAFNTALKDEKERLLQIYGEENEQFLKELNKWIKANIRISLSDSFYEDRKRITDSIDEILAKSKETKDLRISKIWEEIIDLTKSYRDEDNQPIGSDLTQESVAKIKENQEKIVKLREEFRKMMNFTKEEEDTFIALNNVVTSGQMLSDDDYEKYNELKSRNDILSKNKLSKDELKRLYSLYEQLDNLQSRISTQYYVDKVNTFMDSMGKPQITLSDELTSIDDIIKQEEGDTETITSVKKEFEKWFINNHILENIKVKEDNRYVTKQVYKRIYIWNRIIPNEKNIKNILENEDYVSLLGIDSKYVKITPSNKYFFNKLKPEYQTKVIKGVTQDNRGNWLPKPTKESATSEQTKYMQEAGINFAKDDAFVDKDYIRLKQEGGEYWKLLQEYTRLHLEQQQSKPYYTRLWMEIPRKRRGRVEYNALEAKDAATNWFDRVNPFVKKETEDAYSTGQGNYEADESKLEEVTDEDGIKTLVTTDIFGNQPTNIPIKFTKYLNPEKVSRDIAASIVEYGVSLETNKMQHEMNPIFQSLKETLSNPKNAIEKINTTAVSLWGKVLNKGVKDNKASESNMLKAITNFTETYIEGIEKKFEFGVGADRVANHLMKIGSLTLVAPTAAVKNIFAGNIQKSIEAITGEHINSESLAKGEWLFDSKFVPALFKDAYSLTKSLESQLIHLFDPQIDFTDKVGHIPNASLKRDVVDLKVLMGGQKLGEMHISGSSAISMLYHLQIPYKNANGEDSKIRYVDAWELQDGIIQLKEGVDKSWDKDSDNFAQFKLRMQKVIELGQGAYAKENQSNVQRYTSGKLATFMRRFFTPMLMNRWSFDRPNYAMGDFREGYYQTFLKLAAETIVTTGKNWQYFSPEQKKNAMKVVVEIGYSLMFMALISLFGWHDDDKNKYKKLQDNWAQAYLLYQLMLIKSETETFIPIPGMGWDETYRLITTPTVAFNTLGKYLKLVKHAGLAAMNSDDAVYDKDTGLYNEGDYKYIADLYSILGIKNFMILNDPKEGIKQYMMLQRRY